MELPPFTQNVQFVTNAKDLKNEAGYLQQVSDKALGGPNQQWYVCVDVDFMDPTFPTNLRYAPKPKAYITPTHTHYYKSTTTYDQKYVIVELVLYGDQRYKYFFVRETSKPASVATKWRKANPVKAKINAQKARNKKTPAERKKYAAEYYQANKDKLYLKQADRYATYPLKRKEQLKG